jgi:RNA polymerase sigma-70 factor, ECF subfamily
MSADASTSSHAVASALAADARAEQAQSADGAEADVRRALEAGDHERALAALMSLYGDRVHAYCSRMLGNDAEADDLVQVIFLQAFQGLPSFVERSSYRAWLFSIARNRALDEARRKRRWWKVIRRPAVIPPVSDPRPGSDHQLAHEELNRHLQSCLELLPAGMRETVVLRFQQEMDYDQIATIVGNKVGALRVKVNRAMAALRRCLEQKGAWR